MRALLGATLALTWTLMGCGSNGDGSAETAESPGASSPSAAEPSESSATPAPDVSVVVIGDSIPYNLETDCPGCTAFADSYGEALGQELGQTVGVLNRSRHDGAQTQDIADQLEAGDLTEALATADVVIVSIGFNDQPPYIDPEQPCGTTEPASAQDAVDAVVVTTRKCVDSATAATRETAADVLSQVQEQAPEAVIAALVPYNSWTGWSELEANPKSTQRTVTELVVYALDTWRTALCAEVKALKGQCVDVYTSFNGPDGTRPAGELLAADYTHPSQEGNDRIRDLLLEARLLS